MNIAHGLQLLAFVSILLGLIFGTVALLSLANDHPKIGLPILIGVIGIFVFLVGAYI